MPFIRLLFLLLFSLCSMGVSSQQRQPKFDNPSMFPELDAYRKSLRKERV